MCVYLLRRSSSLIPILISITFLAYVLDNLALGDPAQMIYTTKYGKMPPSQAAAESRGVQWRNRYLLISMKGMSS